MQCTILQGLAKKISQALDVWEISTIEYSASINHSDDGMPPHKRLFRPQDVAPLAVDGSPSVSVSIYIQVSYTADNLLYLGSD